MDELNCLFKRKPTANGKHCNLTADCIRCAWNLNSGENERRKLQIKLYGLTQREDGLRGLVLQR